MLGMSTVPFWPTFCNWIAKYLAACSIPAVAVVRIGAADEEKIEFGAFAVPEFSVNILQADKRSASVDRERPFLLDPALVDVNGPLGGLGFPDDQNVRDLLGLPEANLVSELLVRRVDLDAEAAVAQRIPDDPGILELMLGDRDDDGLHRSEPGREVPAEVLDQHAEKSLHRTGESTMDHDRRVVGPVAPAVRQAETLGEDEVDLNRPELPTPSERIVQVDVELGTVERAAAFIELIREAAPGQGLANRFFGDCVGRAALLARREEILEVVELERLHQPQRLIEGLLELTLELLRRTEEVRVVLGEATDAGESMERPAALEAIDRPEFRVTQRQIAVRMRLALVDEDVSGAVHRFEPKPLALDLDRPEHRVREVLQVPRGFVELFVDDVGRHDGLIAAFAQTGADEILDDSTDDRAFGVPKDEPPSGVFFDAEEAEFGPEFAVIALGGFF